MNKLCECGCGKEIIRKRDKFLYGHKKRLIENIQKLPHKNKSRLLSEETKRKISNSNKGKIHPPFSLDVLLKMSESHKGIKLTDKHKLKISESHKGMSGKNHSDQTKQKLSICFKGRKHSIDTRIKMSKNQQGKVLSEEHKKKISFGCIKYIGKTKFDGQLFFPRTGNNEKIILDPVQERIGLNILRNDRNIHYKCGKWPDGYIEKYNLCIDVLENYHFKVSGELIDNDQDRELTIAYWLGCMIYYIPEQEFLKDPEKEIQRLKDFIILLEQGRN